MNTAGQHVRQLLEASPGYRALATDRRREIARDTVHVAVYLVDPDGLLSQEFRRPLLAAVVRSERGLLHAMSDSIVPTPGAFDSLVAAVDFPSFVAGLIHGVFNAIVAVSIEQMQAYADLIKSVSASVDEFARDKIDERSARDALVAAFPDAFCWSGGKLARLQLHAAAGSAALSRLSVAIGLRELVTDPKRAGEVARIVSAARRRIARNRQQQLATMVMMGINRCGFCGGPPST